MHSPTAAILWPSLILCALLALPQPLTAADPPAPSAGAAQKVRRAAKAPKALKTGKKAPAGRKIQGGEQPRLSAEDLQTPYSALTGTPGGQQNATRLDFDPTPTTGPFAPPEQDPALKLRLGREQRLDPFTGQDITPRPDTAGAKESLKNRDIKGALDKVGGKAEVQVDILRF